MDIRLNHYDFDILKKIDANDRKVGAAGILGAVGRAAPCMPLNGMMGGFAVKLSGIDFDILSGRIGELRPSQNMDNRQLAIAGRDDPRNARDMGKVAFWSAIARRYGAA